jgi:hypothetical protein
MRCLVKAIARPLDSQESNSIPILQEADWVPGNVWMDAENLGLAGIRSPEHPARTNLPYRLRYPCAVDLSRILIWILKKIPLKMCNCSSGIGRMDQ